MLCWSRNGEDGIPVTVARANDLIFTCASTRTSTVQARHWQKHASSPLFSCPLENWPRNLLVIRHILVFNELASLIPYRPLSR